MMNLRNSSDQISAYLAGLMSPEQQQAFEAECAENPELAAEVRDSAQLYAAFSVADQAQGNHVESEHLAMYAEGSTELDAAVKSDIETHLRSCQECSSELKACRGAVEAATRQSAGVHENWLQRLADLVLPTRRGLRPGFALAAAILVVLATYSVTIQVVRHDARSERFEIEGGTLRSAGTGNQLTVSRGTPMVALEFLLPTIEGRYYDYRLADSGGTAVMTVHNQPHRMPATMQIPVSVLSEGSYAILVTEEPPPVGGHVPDTFLVRFSVEFSEH